MKLYYLFKLSRPANLLIIAVTMTALRYLLIKPLLADSGIQLVISHLDFLIILISTVMIAAAGNIINDYFDIKPDRVNKRHKLIVGKHIKRREAMAAHAIFSTVGFFILNKTRKSDRLIKAIFQGSPLLIISSIVLIGFETLVVVRNAFKFPA